MTFPDLCVEVGVTCYLDFLLLGDRLLLCSPDWPWTDNPFSVARYITMSLFCRVLWLETLSFWTSSNLHSKSCLWSHLLRPHLGGTDVRNPISWTILENLLLWEFYFLLCLQCSLELSQSVCGLTNHLCKQGVSVTFSFLKIFMIQYKV